jgi:hypothetical protein
MAMGVDVDRVEHALRGPGWRSWTGSPSPRRASPRLGWGWALPATRNDSRLAVNRLLAEGAAVHRNHAGTPELGELGVPGAFLVERGGAATPSSDAGAVPRSWGWHPAPLAAAPSGLAAARGASPGSPGWGSTCPGRRTWTRGGPATSSGSSSSRGHPPERRHPGDLSGYDVILFADQGAGSIVNGHSEGSRPPEFTGGVGTGGDGEPEALGRGRGDPGRLRRGLGLRDPSAGSPGPERHRRGSRTSEFFIPGSLLRTGSTGAPGGLRDAGGGRLLLPGFPGLRGHRGPGPGDVVALRRGGPPDERVGAGGDRHLAGRAAVVHARVGPDRRSSSASARSSGPSPPARTSSSSTRSTGRPPGGDPRAPHPRDDTRGRGPFDRAFTVEEANALVPELEVGLSGSWTAPGGTRVPHGWTGSRSWTSSGGGKLSEPGNPDRGEFLSERAAVRRPIHRIDALVSDPPRAPGGPVSPRGAGAGARGLPHDPRRALGLPLLEARGGRCGAGTSWGGGYAGRRPLTPREARMGVPGPAGWDEA